MVESSRYQPKCARCGQFMSWNDATLRSVEAESFATTRQRINLLPPSRTHWHVECFFERGWENIKRSLSIHKWVSLPSADEWTVDQWTGNAVRRLRKFI